MDATEITKIRKVIENRGKVQEIIGEVFFLICLLACYLIGKVFFSLNIETKISNINLNIPFWIVILITTLFLTSFILFISEKKNLYKECQISEANNQSKRFIEELKSEANLENNNLSFQAINFNYLPRHIETIRFLVGTFFILGLAGSFSGIAEVVAKVIETLASMSQSSSAGVIDLSKALATIKEPLQPLKTVFLVTILGLISALIVENFLQVLYKKVANLENEISSYARKEIINLSSNKRQLLANIDNALTTLVKQSNENFETLKTNFKHHNQALLTSITDSDNKFITEFNNKNAEALKLQVKLVNNLKESVKQDFKGFFEQLKTKSDDLNSELLEIFEQQGNVYKTIKSQLDLFFSNQNQIILENQDTITKHFSLLGKQNEGLVTELKTANKISLKNQEQTLSNLKENLAGELHSLLNQLNLKAETIKSELIKPLTSQKEFFDKVNIHQDKLFKDQNKIIEKHNNKVDEYYEKFGAVYNNYFDQIKTNLNTVENSFNIVNTSIEPIINMLGNTGKLLLNVEQNLAGLGERNDYILAKLNSYLSLTETVLDNKKVFFDELKSYLQEQEKLLQNQKGLLTNFNENVQKMNEISNISTEYQRKIELMREYYKMHLTSDNVTEVTT